MTDIRIPESEQPQFQRQQAEIYQDMAQELIALTPEHWDSAVLELSTGEEGISHSIWSDEGHRDVVAPSMDLFGHTRLLELLFMRYECMWQVAKFRVFLRPDGNWSFEVEYEY
jgi:hypothetical protein